MSGSVDAQHQGLLPWIEDLLGGRVTSCDRQGDRRSGGRPAYFVEVETPGGEAKRLYARMSRGMGSGGPFSLSAEHAVLQELHAAGIAVPEPLGLCPDPECLLLECLPGDFDYAAIDDEARRDAIDRAFVAEIAKVHALDVGRFESRGLRAPKTQDEFALNDLAHWEKAFQYGAKRPVPLVRFALRWLHGHVPAMPERAVLIQGDTGPGQFLFEGGALTGIIDWEFAHLGDPMLDLAQIRTRDWYNPGADLKKWFAYYAEYSGLPVDLPRLRYYTVKAMLITPLALAGPVHSMHPSLDHAEWYAQDVSYQRGVAEALAEAAGIELEPYAPEEPPASLRAPVFEILEHELENAIPGMVEDAFHSYRVGLTRRLATYARNIERLGPAFEAAELKEMGALLGQRPADVATGNAQLEEFVESPSLSDHQEERLVRYFHRHAVREERLMQGALGAGEHAVRQPIA
ncbi:MAG: phosphotransferase family protein [Myxococcota bacterium]